MKSPRFYIILFYIIFFIQVLEEQHVTLEMDLSNLVNSCEFVDNMLSFGNEAEIMTINKIMVILIICS